MRSKNGIPKSQWLLTGVHVICGALLVGCDGSSGELFENAVGCNSSGDCPSGQECSAGSCVVTDGEDASVSDDAGPDGATDPNGPCIPKTCVTIGVLGGGTPCGKPWDGCGNYIDCGECEGTGEVCGEADSASPYICIPGGDGGTSVGDGGNDDGDGGANTDGGPNADSGGDTEPVCIPEKRTPQLVPLDVFLMLDKSGSMSEGGRWTSVTNALETFVESDDARGMGFGLGYYPIPRGPSTPPPPASCVSNADCSPYFGDCISWPPSAKCEATLVGIDASCMGDDYKVPAVGIEPLPSGAASIKASLDATTADGDITPTHPALDGAHLYAKAWAQNNPGHLTVVVLATDGQPNNCGSETTNTPTNIALRAEQAFQGNPSIPTYVIGIGDKTGDLDPIAASGGTNAAVHLSDANAYQGFLDALHAIRTSVKCEYQIPENTGSMPGFPGVELRVTKDEITETLDRVGSSAQCDSDEGGWHYDDQAHPNKIVLCPKSCELVESGTDAAPVELEIWLTCN